MNPYLSVLIPTYNRSEKLEKCLAALASQDLSLSSFEILVIDDGSTDETQALLKKKTHEYENLRVFHQENQGQGAARNRGIHEARGQVILFIGDDIYASPDLLARHVQFHEDHPEPKYAALGLTEWDPSQELTPFMVWLTHGGPQFAYHHLAPDTEASYRYFYTSNLSLKRTLLEKESFDENFKGYGWEDMELGFRLQVKQGLKLIYLPEALAYHEHPVGEASLKNKMFQIGKNARVFQKKWPATEVVPGKAKQVLHGILTSLPMLALAWLLKTLLPKIFSTTYWRLLAKRYFLQGLKSI